MTTTKPSEYRDVAELVRDLTEDQAAADQFDEHLERRKIVHFLFAQRSAGGLSQQELAEKLGCSQSRVSKLENSEDDDLRLGDLKDYLQALDRNLVLLSVENSASAVEQIKFHALMINRCLHHLQQLAKQDATLAKGVGKFHLETLFNLSRMIMDGVQELPDFPGLLPSIMDASPNATDGLGNVADRATNSHSVST